MDRDDELRVAHNESAFRDVNERLRAGTTVADADQRFPFACECAVVGCNSLLQLTLPEYEAVRAEGSRFVVLPGHEVPEVERVVDEGDGWLVVEKTGAGAEQARDEDPRSP